MPVRLSAAAKALAPRLFDQPADFITPSMLILGIPSRQFYVPRKVLRRTDWALLIGLSGEFRIHAHVHTPNDKWQGKASNPPRHTLRSSGGRKSPEALPRGHSV